MHTRTSSRTPSRRTDREADAIVVDGANRDADGDDECHDDAVGHRITIVDAIGYRDAVAAPDTDGDREVEMGGGGSWRFACFCMSCGDEHSDNERGEGAGWGRTDHQEIHNPWVEAEAGAEADNDLQIYLALGTSC